MKESSPTAEEPRNPEQLAAVRRRALPVAIAAITFGVAGLAWLYNSPVAVRRPPNLLAANLSFCAMMMGVGILFYARKTPGTGLARGLCLAAIFLGVAGPVIFAKQSVDWHRTMEDQESQNASAIALAARRFAADHSGKYPTDFLELLQGKYLEPDALLSPFGGAGTEYLANLKTPPAPEAQAQILAEHADYTYTGADLRLPLDDAAATKIIAVYETDPVMRDHFAVGFADGSSKFLVLDDAQSTMAQCNDARKSQGLPPLQEPDSVQRAMKAEAQH